MFNQSIELGRMLVGEVLHIHYTCITFMCVMRSINLLHYSIYGLHTYGTFITCITFMCEGIDLNLKD